LAVGAPEALISRLLLLFALASGCSPSEATMALHVPDSYHPGRPAPLVILLHGYPGSGAAEEAYLELTPLSDRHGFLYLHPDGSPERSPAMGRFWNATDACCDFYRSGVDHVAMLDGLIDDLEARYAIDPRRIFIVGHSNGGFMAHRMGCDAADRVAAIVSLAGATWKDPARCRPAAPVAVLEVHGDADTQIAYRGGLLSTHAYPGARETVADWAADLGCAGSLEATTTRLDLDTTIAGAETTVERYAGCPAGAAELWTVQGGAHAPALATDASGLDATPFGDLVYGWLSAHAKP
jgi:polyhydroxybutyrate depolymerase